MKFIVSTTKLKLLFDCQELRHQHHEQDNSLQRNEFDRFSLLGYSDGKVEIPISIFQTFLMTPHSCQRVHPAGFRMESSTYHMGVVDAQGTLYVNVSSGFPTYTFKTSKNLR